MAATVPDPALRLDLEALDRPFAGALFGGTADVREAVARYIEQDLALRDSPDHPETLALFVALLKMYMDLGRLVPAERLNARSQQTVHGWWHGFFSFVDSGPPPASAPGDAGTAPGRAAAVPGPGPERHGG